VICLLAMSAVPRMLVAMADLKSHLLYAGEDALTDAASLRLMTMPLDSVAGIGQLIES
jgi:hypothetical protein